ncbi:myeloid leukemia factor isoform X1 [Microplitis demolitor]|uniref:myeloid leukemia factor isoform X1 n=1 Tax=Microplitis demolitor TaxID=69319 RepID=UPI0004CCA7AD|nr:myeloid leukemia factor isoform X1 [Microplitis demolitor]
MSLFGSLMGDIEDDPIFGSHMQSMNSMMNFFSNPFGMMTPALMGPGQDMMNQRRHPAAPARNIHNQMMPFGFPMPPMNMNAMFSNFDNMAGSNCMTSTSIMTYTNGPDGRPQVYQASKSMRAGPGGVKETKESVFDSRSGTKKMAIGHHIGERAHIIEKKKDLRNGDEEEHQEFINLEDDEADKFNQEWEQRIRSHGRGSRNDAQAAIDYSPHHRRHHHHHRGGGGQLALTDGTTRQNERSRVPSTRRSIRSLTSNSRNKVSDSQVDDKTESDDKPKAAETSGRRKHEDDNEEDEDNDNNKKKRHLSSSDD